MTALVSQARARNGPAPGQDGQDAPGQPEADILPGATPGMFRAVMRHHAKGVAIITAGVDVPAGFCATSLTSISLDPPLVAFTVGQRATSRATVQSARHVMVHLLTDGQEELARRFGARADPAKFGPRTRWHRGALGLPVLDDVLAWLLLALVSQVPVGDHHLVIGRVVAARQGAGGVPLIHLGSEFVRLAVP